jgi:hypothetical protein
MHCKVRQPLLLQGSGSASAKSARFRRAAVQCSALPVSRREAVTGFTCLTAAGLLLPSGLAAAAESSAYDFTAVQYDKEVSLSQFKNKVTVIMNIASE